MDKEQQLNELFALAREQRPQASFEETKSLFLETAGHHHASKATGNSAVFTSKIRWIMSAFIIISAFVSSILFWPENQKNNTSSINPHSSIASQEEKNPGKAEKSEGAKIDKEKQESLRPIAAEVFSDGQNPAVFKLPSEPVSALSSEDENQANRWIGKLPVDDDYPFPKLTEEQIKKTLKQKKKMLRALAKKDKDYYAYIPSGSFDYKGKMISVQAFYMQKTEVSNLEYRTFLFDLLIQNRKDEFLKAKPDQQAWKIALGDSAQFMIDNYISNEGYNDYPVNNISREGAEMYCKWLSAELYAYLGEEKGKKLNDVRLPNREEWFKAASVEGTQLPYPYDDTTLFDPTFYIYKANFNLKGMDLPLKKNLKVQMDNSPYFPSIKYTFLGKTRDYTWNINTKYFINSYGLYNISGNVAEMVVDGAEILTTESKTRQKSLLTPGTAGGGWMNSPKEIKILAPDNHPGETKAHPNIGFRVVMTHLPGGTR